MKGKKPVPKKMKLDDGGKAKTIKVKTAKPDSMTNEKKLKIQKPAVKQDTQSQDAQPTFDKMKISETDGISKQTSLTKKERRTLRLKRRLHGDTIQQLLHLWEQMRRGDTQESKRWQLCDEVLKLSKGKICDLVTSRDTARVFQSVFQLGKVEHKWQLFEAVKANLIPLIKSRYSRFVIKKMLAYGTKEHRQHVFQSMKGHVVSLVKRKFSAEVLEFAYNDYANASQRASILREIYGPAFKTSQVAKLDEAIALDPSRKQVILDNLKKLLLTVLDKGLVQHSLIHHLLHEYLTQFPHTPHEDQANPDFTEITQSLHTNLVPLLHTREGTKVAMMTVWASTTKERKTIIRSLKTCVANIASNEHGYLFLLALIDSVDDVVVMNNVIIKELCESALDLLSSSPGRKVLLYLMCYRDPLHFHPGLLALLTPGDSNPHSKKDRMQRVSELRGRMVMNLLQLAADRIDCYLVDNARMLLLAELLTKCTTPSLDLPEGDVTSVRNQALRSLTALLALPFTPVGHVASPQSAATGKDKRKRKIKLQRQHKEEEAKRLKFSVVKFSGPAEGAAERMEVDEAGENTDPESGMHLVERLGTQVLLRRLLHYDRSQGRSELSNLILAIVPADNLRSWIVCNRSCFLLVYLFECGDESVCSTLRGILQPVLSTLQQSPLSGAKVLSSKMVTSVS